MRAVVIAILIGACAPAIDGPVEHQRAVDREDGDRLAAQLAHLPGAVSAQVTLHRPVTDPLTRQATPASAAILVIVDDRADHAAITSATRELVAGTAPEIPAPVIAIALGAIRPQLAHVGPFSVELGSKAALTGALVAACAVIAALAGWIAWRERWRIRA